MIDLCIYHGGCLDGFCAAWLVHSVWPNAEFLPCQYGQEPPDVTGRHVVVVDFSFKRPLLETMAAKAASILILDHHKTAEADLAGLDYCRFDMTKSGARMAWEWLYGRTSDCWPVLLNKFKRCDQQSPPWLVLYTEDRDLWHHRLPHTKEINAALRTWPMSFDAWDALAADPQMPECLRLEGLGTLRYQQKVIDSHIRHAQEVDLMGHKVLCVNCTCADLTSEVAGALAKGRPFGMCWFESDENERIYSLRSAPDGIDVSEIAKAHGGGGHKHAAGFKMAATGAIGTFSDGALTPQDEGDLRLAIVTDKTNGLVHVEFGKAVKWLGMRKGEALQFAEKIRFAAGKLTA